MSEIFAWTCVILTCMILLFYAIGLAKAAFFKSANRRKEILKVLIALPMLLWCFMEFFLVLFRVLPDNQEKSSHPSNFIGKLRKSSLEKRWGDIEGDDDPKEDDYDG